MEKLCIKTKIATIDSRGLPYEMTFVLNTHYMLSTNVDVSDRLSNSAGEIRLFLSNVTVQNYNII